MSNFLGTLAQDVRYGIRNLAKNPGFALIAMLTLALGIGANTTIFSIINSTLLKPIAYPDPDRLVLVWETFGKPPNNQNIVSNPNFQDFRRMAHSFESMAIMDSSGRGYNLSSTNDKDAERANGLRVTASFFDVLGVKPLMGRTFTPDEEILGKDHEVVLSYSLWKSHFNGDPAIIGKTTRIDGDDFTVIGVMPENFTWQFWGPLRKLWVPVGYTKTDVGRGNNSFISIARLKPGVSVSQARQEMEAIAAGVQAEHPEEDANMSATVEQLSEYGMADARRSGYALFAAVGFVMLIACVNVANLLLARGAARQKEFALRRALGASASRMARQMMTESLLLSLAGGLLGLGLAAATVKVLATKFVLAQIALPLRPVQSINLDANVFLFTLAASMFTGILFGLAPAWSALRPALNDTLKEGGRTGGGAKNRFRHALVAAEVALALVVLCGAGLMIKSMSRLLGVDPGFDPNNVLLTNMTVPQEETYVGPPGLPRFCQDVQDHLGTMPGILSVSAIAHLPMMGNAGRGFQIEGRPPAAPGKMPGASYTVACPNYFRTMGIPVIAGREFNERDTAASPGVIIINESLKKAFWKDQDPIGTAVHLNDVNGPRLTIVGIVRDVHFQGLDNAPRRQFFRPYQQAGWPMMNIIAKTAGVPMTFSQGIKKSLGDAFPDRPSTKYMTMQDVINDSVGSRRFPMVLLSVFAGLALVLAAVGIVGAVGHSVTQRTQEIGIRMALGARAIDVLRLMIGGNMIWVFAGLAVGVAGSLALTRVLTDLLFQVQPFDPSVIGGVAALLAAVALLASYIPARRAAHIDPLSALRCE